MPSRRTFFKRASGIVAATVCALYIPSERLEFGVPKALALPEEEPRGVTLADFARQYQPANQQIAKLFEEYGPVLELVNGVPRANFIEGWEPETRLPSLERWVNDDDPSFMLARLDEALDVANSNGLSVSEIRLTREHRATLTAACGVDPDAETQDEWSRKRLIAYRGIPVARADRSELRIEKV
jgi:hypothetical protein